TARIVPAMAPLSSSCRICVSTPLASHLALEIRPRPCSALHPPLEGEGRSLPRSGCERGGGNCEASITEKIHPHPTAFAARKRSTSPLQGEVRGACGSDVFHLHHQRHPPS